MTAHRFPFARTRRRSNRCHPTPRPSERASCSSAPCRPDLRVPGRLAPVLHGLRAAPASRPGDPRLHAEDDRGQDAHVVRRRHPGARLHLLRRHRGRAWSPRWSGPGRPRWASRTSTSGGNRSVPTGAMVEEISAGAGDRAQDRMGADAAGRRAAHGRRSDQVGRRCSATRPEPRFRRESGASSPGSGRPMAAQTEHVLTRAHERFAVQDYYGTVHLLEEIVAGGRAFADVHHLLGVSLSLLGQRERALGEFRSRAGAQPPLPRGADPPRSGAVRDGAGHRSGGLVPPRFGQRVAFLRRVAGADRRAAGQPARRAGRGVRRGRRARQGGRAVPAGARAGTGLRGPALSDGPPAARVGALARGARGVGGGAADLRPNFVDAAAALGLAHYLSGDAMGARDIWKGCLQRRPENARVEAYLAMLGRTGS